MSNDDNFDSSASEYSVPPLPTCVNGQETATFEVDLDACTVSMIVGDEKLVVDEWDFGFDEGDTLALHFIAREPGQSLEAFVSPCDEDGCTGDWSTLAAEGDARVYTCVRPETNDGPAYLLIFQAAQAISERRASETSVVEEGPGDIKDPESAQPKVVLRPRKDCPSGDPPTGDVKA